MASLRRSGARLLSLGSGHGELIMTISQIRELRATSKALIAAEEATIDDLVKWSAKEENRAIKDVVERFSELCAFWTEAQKELVEQLKEVRGHFEMILEGEKSVDAARGLVEAAEAREAKLRKEHKKLMKKSSPPTEELRDIEDKVAKVQRDKDFAEHEATLKVKDHEAVKLIRLKEALKKFTSGQRVLSEKTNLVFSAADEVVQQIPDLSVDMEDDVLQNMKYRGAPVTTAIVMRTKNELKEYKPYVNPRCSCTSPSSAVRSSPTALPSSPPSYDDIHNQLHQPPTNPYYIPDENAAYNNCHDAALYPALRTQFSAPSLR